MAGLKFGPGSMGAMSAIPFDADTRHNPYGAYRVPLLAPNGVVATSQPLAAQAGLRTLLKGGNAVDAALATAIALTVVEPSSNNIGSDAFALVWDPAERKVQGINGSGRAPAGTTVAAIRAAGHTSMPERGWWAVTVPGAPRTWVDLHERYGRLPFEQLFEPAIEYAEHGFPMAPHTGYFWAAGVRAFAPYRDDPAFAPWFQAFTRDGEAPRVGETWRNPDQARALRLIAATRAQGYYAGEIARAAARHARETGGTLTEADFAAHTSTWVEPIGTSYRGYDVWEIPPNGQGIATLIGLNILEGTDVAGQPRDTVESYHCQIEAMKLAFTDARRYVADMEHATVPVRGLLDKRYAAERRALIGEQALDPSPGAPERGGTVYLCAADKDGLMVSYIQSNYMGFGSGIVVPGFGVAIQNRGAGFTLEDGHPNQVAPGKRPFHTIIPGFLTRDGEPIGPFGVMGGFMQAQGHLQVMVNTIDYHLNPQAALDAPRWQFVQGRTVALEADTPQEIVDGLRARGHDVRLEEPSVVMGRGQVIWRLPEGGYIAGSDTKRADGQAVGY